MATIEQAEQQKLKNSMLEDIRHKLETLKTSNGV